MTPIEKTIIESLDWVMNNINSNDEIQDRFKFEIQNEINELLYPKEDKEPCCDMDALQNKTEEGKK